MKPNFRDDELIVFVGHSGDAGAEAAVVRKLQGEFQDELRRRIGSDENTPSLRSVKVWEWNSDAEGRPGGQGALIDPVVDAAHVGIFVFRDRVGEGTRTEVERFLARGEESLPIYAIFPAKPQGSLDDDEVLYAWTDLRRYRDELQADFAAEGNHAVRPLELYSDHGSLERIIVEQFRKDLGPVILRRSAPRLRERQPRDNFLARVEKVCRLKGGEESNIEWIRWAPDSRQYLSISTGRVSLARVYPVGAVRGDLTSDDLYAFVAIHRRYQRTDSGLISTLVYGGEPASAELLEEAAAQRIRLSSFVEFQGLIDFRPYVKQQTHRLGNDPLYPPGLYVPQQLRFQADQKEQQADALNKSPNGSLSPMGASC